MDKQLLPKLICMRRESALATDGAAGQIQNGGVIPWMVRFEFFTWTGCRQIAWNITIGQSWQGCVITKTLLRDL